jgi:hypothetical protein
MTWNEATVTYLRYLLLHDCVSTDFNIINITLTFTFIRLHIISYNLY